MNDGRALARRLRGRGIDTIYGRPLRGVAVIDVEDAEVAALLVQVHARVTGRAAVVHVGDGVVRDAAGSVVDPEAPVPPPEDRWREPDDELVERLRAAERPVLLVGPGVVRAGAVPGLHAIAAAADLGVLNTWGAKGVFDWRSRHHLATAGLQAEDYRLGGLADADLIVTSGLDPDEAPEEQWRLAPTVDVDPGMLDPLAARWSRPPGTIDVPPLRTGLAAVTQDGWARSSAPLAPTWVTRAYATVLGPGALVAADAGTVGFWVARTYATTELGAVQVPGRRLAGFAAAVALVARLLDPLRPVLAVVDDVDGATAAVLAEAGRQGIGLPVEVWTPAGDALDADRHEARLRSLVASDDPPVAPLATDPEQLDRIVEVAGPVVAWGGAR